MQRFRFLFVLVGGGVVAPEAWACPWCRVEVREAVYTPDFVSTTLLLLLPLLVIALVGVGLHFADGRRPASRKVDPYGNDV